jgi:small subunit ribosomal protein S13
MPRIAGADVPEKKRIVISLCYIYGIGRTLSTKILAKAKIDESTRAKDLTEEQLTTLKNIIDGFGFPIEGELRRIVFQNIKRKKDIQSYQGVRHQKNLPVRGQKTQKNARTLNQSFKM